MPRIAPAAQQAVYAGLAHMLRSGVPADRALKSLTPSGSRHADAALDTARRAVAAGRPLTVALHDAGLLQAADRTLVENAERSGRVDAALEMCARRLQARIERDRTLRTRMIAPAAIVVFGCLLSPLPAVVAGNIGLGGYALRALVPLVVIASLIVFLRNLLARAGSGAAGAVESLPILGPVIRRRRILDVLESLQLHLAGGTAAIDALADLAGNTPSGAARRGCETAHGLVVTGSTVTDALDVGKLVSKNEGVPILLAGEQAGRLDTALGRYVKAVREAQASREDTLAQWLPRGVYFAAAAFAAWTMLGA